MSPEFTIREIRLYERPVAMRLPFRFGDTVVTETAEAHVAVVVRDRDRHGRRPVRATDGAALVRQAPATGQSRNGGGVARNSPLAPRGWAWG